MISLLFITMLSLTAITKADRHEPREVIKTTEPGDEFDGLDGKVFHFVFYRFKDKNTIDKARDYCYNFRESIKDEKLPVISVHCGVQNSLEDKSFAQGYNLDKSLEYAFVFTFRSIEYKLDVIDDVDYNSFRDELDELADDIYVKDFIHGERERTNGRPPTSANGPRIPTEGTLYHFSFIKYNDMEQTRGALQFLADMFRDLKLNSVHPHDDEHRLPTTFIWGQQRESEEIYNGDYDYLDLEMAFGITFNNELDRDLFIGRINGEVPEHIKHIGYDLSHDTYKDIIKPYLDEVFVFDFNDEVFDDYY